MYSLWLVIKPSQKHELMPGSASMRNKKKLRAEGFIPLKTRGFFLKV